MIHKFVYAYNQKEALEECRYKFKDLVPVKAKYSGKKHNMRTYMVWCRKRKIK